jgi:hypothetical protein
MTARLLAAPLLVLGLAASLRAGVTIDVQNGLVDLHAVAAPVTEVLERLGERTAVRVVFAQRPATVVDLDLRGLPPRRALEAVLRRMDGGFGYALGLSPNRTRVVAVIVTAPGGVVVKPPDPFQPEKSEALEPVPEAWELDARREAAKLAPPPPTRLPRRPESPPVDPNEPTFGYGIDPFTPPEGRGDRLEPVPLAPPHEAASRSDRAEQRQR